MAETKFLFNKNHKKMASISPKFSINWKDTLEGLLTAALSQPLLTILTSLEAGQFHIDWTAQWQMAVASGAGYLIKTFLSGPKPPTSGTSSGAVKAMSVFLLCFGFYLKGSAQSIFKPLPLTPAKGKVYFRGIVTPTDSTPNISMGEFRGFRFAGPDIAFAVPDFSIYTGLGIDYVVAVADPTTGKWDYNFTIGPRVYGGANLGVPTVQAIGAIGLRITLFKGWLALGGIWNLTTKKLQATIGNPAALIPGLN